MSKNSKLKQIKSSPFQRGLAVARASVSAGAKAASHWVTTAFSTDEEKEESLKKMLNAQVKLLARELGELKGSLMKVGQMLSMYGEHFLPAEANALLKSLQSQSPPMEWSSIEKVLKRQFTPEILDSLEIEQEPIASASLGQVHRARKKSGGPWLAMKIQYPGVDQAIDSDIKALRTVLTLAKFIPRGPQLDEVFKEIKTMLHHEVNYVREMEFTLEFKKLLSDDSRYIIPSVIEECSTRRVLTTTLEEGVPVNSPEVLGLSLERRNAIGLAVLELYFRELFELGQVQTDPHFGNYRIRLGESGRADQVILFDFGAVRKFSKSFLDSYRKMVRGCFYRNEAELIEAGIELGFLRKDDTKEVRSGFVDLCFLIGEPFHLPEQTHSKFFNSEGGYLWGRSDLPRRAALKGAQYALLAKFRSPPREIVFLDRKMGGLFIFLSVLDVQVSARESIRRFI